MVPQDSRVPGPQRTNRGFRRNFGTPHPLDRRVTYTDRQLLPRYLQILGCSWRHIEVIGALLETLEQHVLKGQAQCYASYDDLRGWMADLLERPVTDYGLRQALKLAHETGLLTWTSGYKLPNGEGRTNVYTVLTREVLQRWGSQLADPNWWFGLADRIVAIVVPIGTRGIRAMGQFGARIRGWGSPTKKDCNYSGVDPSESSPPSAERTQKPPSFLVGESASPAASYLEVLLDSPRALLAKLRGVSLPGWLKSALSRLVEADQPLPDHLRAVLLPVLQAVAA